MRNLSDRVDLPDINSFCAILIQADQLGSSIGPVLRAQSDKMRNERFMRAEEKGAKATQLILFPIMAFIVPAFFCIVGGMLYIFMTAT